MATIVNLLSKLLIKLVNPFADIEAKYNPYLGTKLFYLSKENFVNFSKTHKVAMVAENWQYKIVMDKLKKMDLILTRSVYTQIVLSKMGLPIYFIECDVDNRWEADDKKYCRYYFTKIVNDAENPEKIEYDEPKQKKIPSQVIFIPSEENCMRHKCTCEHLNNCYKCPVQTGDFGYFGKTQAEKAFLQVKVQVSQMRATEILVEYENTIIHDIEDSKPRRNKHEGVSNKEYLELLESAKKKLRLTDEVVTLAKRWGKEKHKFESLSLKVHDSLGVNEEDITKSFHELMKIRKDAGQFVRQVVHLGDSISKNNITF